MDGFVNQALETKERGAVLHLGRVSVHVHAPEHVSNLVLMSLHDREKSRALNVAMRSEDATLLKEGLTRAIALAAPAKEPAKATPKGSLKPQSKQVLRYMRRFKVITPLKAMHELGVQSLSRRICDLREAGYAIKRELKQDYRRKRYATYSLAEDLSEHVVGYAPNDQTPSPLTGV